jgi:chromosome segregation ATPase
MNQDDGLADEGREAVAAAQSPEDALAALTAELEIAEALLQEARHLLAEREQGASDLRDENLRLRGQLMNQETVAADALAALAVERSQSAIEVEALRAQITALTKQTFDLQAAVARDGSKLREMDSRLREREQIVVRQAEQLTRRAHEINRRASLLWWFKLPWLRLTRRLPPTP